MKRNSALPKRRTDAASGTNLLSWPYSGALGPWIVRAAVIMLMTFSVMEASTARAGDVDLVKAWTGDYDGMVERRKVRVLVVPNKMFYFIDKGHHRGVNVELFRAFEKFVNGKVKTSSSTDTVADDASIS